MEEAWKPDAVISVAGDNSDFEFKNYIVTDIYESDDGIVRPYSPSVFKGLTRKLFIFGVEYIFDDVDYDYM